MIWDFDWPVALIGGCLAVVVLAVGWGSPMRTAARAAVAGATFAASIVYLWWRVSTYPFFSDLPPADRIASLVFLGCEVIVFFEYGIFLLGMARRRDNKPFADRKAAELRAVPPDGLPEVDVFVTTYNEEWRILSRTIHAVKALDYPKKNIWILDDGRREWLAEKCRQLGVRCVHRPDSSHKKAGNLNHGLSVSSAPFILSIDADFIPFPHFLWRVLGFFEDPKVGAVQTPQYSYNVDPMRNTLGLQRGGFDDQLMFYTEIQPCRDAWNAAFFCGTSGILRRAALEDIGGFVTGCDVEDQITSIALYCKGWVTRFLDEELSMGLAPESLEAFFQQRVRWCRASLQILFTRYGPFSRNRLNPVQRILFSQSFWLLGQIGPIAYALVPAAVWFFGLDIVPKMDSRQMFLVPLVMFCTVSLSTSWLCGRKWIPVISAGIGLFQAVSLLPTAIFSIIKPFGKPLFSKVTRATPKGAEARGGSRFYWKTLLPLAALMAVSIIGIATSNVAQNMLLSDPDVIVTVILWSVVSLTTIGIAMFCCIELPYAREEERFLIDKPCVVGGPGGEESRGVAVNLSMVSALVDSCQPPLSVGEKVTLHVEGFPQLPCAVERYLRNGRALLSFESLDIETEEELVQTLLLNPKVLLPPLTQVRYFIPALIRRLLTSSGS